MPSQNSCALALKDKTPLQADVPLTGATERERLSCFSGQGAPPALVLHFPPATLVPERVDTSRTCLVRVDLGERSAVLTARIVAVRDPETLACEIEQIDWHSQARSHFRVAASTRVAASSAIPEELAREGESWKLLGDTIDLSGSGLLCSFNAPIEEGRRVRIELTLPAGPMDLITAYGHVVRCQQVGAETFYVALAFDAIDPESQDKIMACCFELQRRQLRMRVLVRNPEPPPAET